MYGDPFFLTLEERDKVYYADLSGMGATYSVYRDIFMFQCLIGCRVSDLNRLTKANIVDGCVEYIPQKTKLEHANTVRVPLNQKALDIVKGKYILCYFLGNNPLHREFAKRLKEVTGCKIIALTHLDEFVKSDEGYADETPYDIDPADFLNLIRNAEYVCTDSFHCSVFSILYKRQFFTFRRYNRNTKQSTNSR